MSNLRPLTRSVSGSVLAIEPESSMIASMLVAGTHAAACAAGVLVPLAAPAPKTSKPVAAINRTLRKRFIAPPQSDIRSSILTSARQGCTRYERSVDDQTVEAE